MVGLQSYQVILYLAHFGHQEQLGEGCWAVWLVSPMVVFLVVLSSGTGCRLLLFLRDSVPLSIFTIYECGSSHLLRRLGEVFHSSLSNFTLTFCPESNSDRGRLSGVGHGSTCMMIWFGYPSAVCLVCSKAHSKFVLEHGLF